MLLHVTHRQLAKTITAWVHPCAGRRFIRPYMPDQHREFYAELVSPGTVDGPHGIAAVCVLGSFLRFGASRGPNAPIATKLLVSQMCCCGMCCAGLHLNPATNKHGFNSSVQRAHGAQRVDAPEHTASPQGPRPQDQLIQPARRPPIPDVILCGQRGRGGASLGLGAFWPPGVCVRTRPAPHRHRAWQPRRRRSAVLTPHAYAVRRQGKGLACLRQGTGVGGQWRQGCRRLASVNLPVQAAMAAQYTPTGAL
jgi:hypothetical protein